MRQAAALRGLVVSVTVSGAVVAAGPTAAGQRFSLVGLTREQVSPTALCLYRCV